MNFASFMYSLSRGREADTQIMVTKDPNNDRVAIAGFISTEKLKSVLALVRAAQFGGEKIRELGAELGLTEEQVKDVDEVLFALYFTARKVVETGESGNFGFPNNATLEVVGQDNVPEDDPAEAT